MKFHFLFLYIYFIEIKNYDDRSYLNFAFFFVMIIKGGFKNEKEIACFYGFFKPLNYYVLYS